jgi:hypothetical protein
MAAVLISERFTEGMDLFSKIFRLPPLMNVTSTNVTPYNAFAETLKRNVTAHVPLQSILKEDIEFYEYGLQRYLSDIQQMSSPQPPAARRVPSYT